MAHTYKDKSPYKVDRQPRVQKKERKNNITQNLTRNVSMFMEDESDEDIVSIWDEPAEEQNEE